jgi:hypothetical protein
MPRCIASGDSAPYLLDMGVGVGVGVGVSQSPSGRPGEKRETCCTDGNRITFIRPVPIDRLCGLVVRVPGYTTEMYCASCEVRTEFIYVM